MKKIVKVLFSDGTKLDTASIGSLEILETDDAREISYKKRLHRSKHKTFETEILEHIDEDWLKEYAKDKFDLVEEDDVEEKTIDDFSDSELVQEINFRNIKVPMLKASIVTEDFVTRFIKIMEKENQLLLDNVLTEFENKLNI